VLSFLGLIFLSFVKKDSPLGCTIGYTVSMITFGSLFLLAYKNVLILRFNKILTALSVFGVYSYAMYIWHVPISLSVESVFHKLSLKDSLLFMVLVKYSLSLVFAILITRLLERPFLILRDKFFPRII
jgi:peptidoglycan/LPS O-acetylase OafA/YrhL